MPRRKRRPAICASARSLLKSAAVTVAALLTSIGIGWLKINHAMDDYRPSGGMEQDWPRAGFRGRLIAGLCFGRLKAYGSADRKT
jgi:hypothetical protein